MTHSTGIDLPHIYMIILRESEDELRYALESGLTLPEKINGISPLQVAMGWPAGVRMLLNKVSSSTVPNKYHNWLSMVDNNIRDHDNKIEEYLDSFKVLLEAGYPISIRGIQWTTSTRLQFAFVHELARQRRKLWEMAGACIHPTKLAELMQGYTGIPDTQALDVYTALVAQGIKVDTSLIPGEDDGRSVYGCYQFPINIMEEAYQLGFTDVDPPLQQGRTSLISRCADLSSTASLKAIIWMISKGADIFQKLPGSNTTAAHLLSANMGQKMTIEAYGYVKEHRAFLDDKTCYFRQPGNDYLFSTSTHDTCTCSCSSGGCSTASVALRGVIAYSYKPTNRIWYTAVWFRQFLHFLIDWNQSEPEICRVLIRSLTFDGLGLTHSCCTEINYYWGFEENARDEADLNEIREEQEEELQVFEQLVSEFEAQYDALGLPIMDFLRGVWSDRMIEFHSTHADFDEKHHEETRSLGISLEIGDSEIPLVVQLLAQQVKEVDSDSTD